MFTTHTKSRTSAGTRSVSNRLLSAVMSVAVTVGLLAASATAAHAAPLTDDERTEALWYADLLKFDELQTQGATGEGIKIAVIDRAINLDAAELHGANITVMGSYCAFPETGEPVPAVSADLERASHGTAVAAMLVGSGVAADGGLGTRGIVPDAEVMFYATGLPDEQYNPDGPQCEEYDVDAEEFYEDKNIELDDPDYFSGSPDAYAAWHAIDHGADIIVYSIISGDIYGWIPTLKKALRAGVPIVAGTPNPDGEILERFYPYSLNGAVAVSGVDNNGQILSGDGTWLSGEAMGSTNLGFVSAAAYLLGPSNSEAWEPSYVSGTSIATPLVAGTLALGMQKFPGATANQVLQAMIRTTGNAGLHEPEWVGYKWGYGIANPTALLATNPLDYPDENPLFAFDMDDPRCIFADEGKAGDWDGMRGMEGCAWSNSPSGEEVWPTNSGDESASEPTAEDALQAQPGAPLMWVVGGVMLLAIVAGAIVVPILVTRSRRNRS